MGWMMMTMISDLGAEKESSETKLPLLQSAPSHGTIQPLCVSVSPLGVGPPTEVGPFSGYMVEVRLEELCSTSQDTQYLNHNLHHLT